MTDSLFHVLILDGLASEGLEVFRREPRLKVSQPPRLSGDALLEAVKDADALVVRSATTVTAELIAAAKRLKVIGRPGTGVDNIDVEAATRRGVAVMSTPGGNTVTTAEHTLALLMALARRIPQTAGALRAGRWEKGKTLGVELSGKTLGLVGLGRIGRAVAERAQGLKMRVIAFDPYLDKVQADRLGVEPVTLDQLYARADVVSVHVPLTPETLGLIGREALGRMKPGALLINCARGGLVDEAALAEALRAGRIAGAALDVFAQEPPPPDHPLLGLDNLIATPHLGAATAEAQTQVSRAVAEQIVDFLLRGELRGAVNAPGLDPQRWRELGPAMDLARRLGALGAQWGPGALTEVRLEAAPSVPAGDRQVLMASALAGALSPAVEGVNLINAEAIAKERGLAFLACDLAPGPGPTPLIAVSLRGEREALRLEGALAGAGMPRTLRVDGMLLEAGLAGPMLAIRNWDRPGVIGRLGTLLGERGVNIAGFHLGRERQAARAICLVALDQPPDPGTLKALAGLPDLISVHAVTLPGSALDS